MADINVVSQQAFNQQISHWQTTLHIQNKKLKQLKKISNNKLQINSIEIAMIEIQSQLIQYKKIKEKKYKQNYLLIEDYTILSKRFMNIMEKIADAAQQQKYKNSHLNIQKDSSQISQQNNQNMPKHFLQETFAYKMSKGAKQQKNKSVIQAKQQLKQDISRSRQCQSRKSSIGKSQISKKMPQRMHSNLYNLQIEQEQDLTDVRYQLRQIKSMMKQIENEIKYHNHDEYDKQINKLLQNNKRLNSQMKNLKEDNQFIMVRLQNIKEQINGQRKIQNEMIKQFELGKEGKNAINQLHQSKNINQEVSDWVKVRI